MINCISLHAASQPFIDFRCKLWQLSLLYSIKLISIVIRCSFNRLGLQLVSFNRGELNVVSSTWNILQLRPNYKAPKLQLNAADMRLQNSKYVLNAVFSTESGVAD